MTGATHNNSVHLDMTSAEAWVAHSAVLAEIKRTADSNRDVHAEMALLDTVESDDSFDADELDTLRDALEAYLDDAPEHDYEDAHSILDTLDEQLP